MRDVGTRPLVGGHKEIGRITGPRGFYTDVRNFLTMSPEY